MGGEDDDVVCLDDSSGEEGTGDLEVGASKVQEPCNPKRVPLWPLLQVAAPASPSPKPSRQSTGWAGVGAPSATVASPVAAADAPRAAVGAFGGSATCAPPPKRARTTTHPLCDPFQDVDVVWCSPVPSGLAPSQPSNALGACSGSGPGRAGGGAGSAAGGGVIACADLDATPSKGLGRSRSQAAPQSQGQDSQAFYEYESDGDGEDAGGFFTDLLAEVDAETNEINRLCDGCRAGRFVDSAKNLLVVHVGVSLARLGIDQELALALGLLWDPESFVTLQLTLANIHLLSSFHGLRFTCPLEECRQASADSDFSSPSLKEEPQLRMRWWLTRKMNERLVKVEWPRRPRATLVETPTHLVEDLKGLAGCSHAEAIQVLPMCAYDVHAAFDVLVAAKGSGGGKVGRQSEPIDVDAWECEEEGEADSRCWTVTSAMLGAGSAWSSSPAVGAGGGAGVGLGGRSQGATLGLGLPSFLSPHLLQSYDVDSVPLWECQMEAWSLLVCVLHAIEESILSCNKACLVCDKALDFVAIKPSICNAELCLTRLTMFGFGLDVINELQINACVSDLLISMFYAAAHNVARIDLCFPREVVSRDGGLHFRCPDGSDNVLLLQAVLNAMPPVHVMVALAGGTESGLRAALETVHPLLFPLLRWLFASSKGLLRKLQPDEKIRGDMARHDQFVLQCGPAETQRSFQQLRASYGSFWAWHGSDWSNWHSILRNGLKNMSASKYMTTGAIHGAGIYLADSFQVSLGYSLRASSRWKHSAFDKCACVALCEIVEARTSHYPVPGEVKNAADTGNGNVVVVSNEALVTTRVLILAPTVPTASGGGVCLASTLLPPVPPSALGARGASSGRFGSHLKASRKGQRRTGK